MKTEPRTSPALVETLFRGVGVDVRESSPITVATNDQFHEKTPLGGRAYAYGWINRSFANVHELADWLRSGNAICTANLRGAHRAEIDVNNVPIVGLDFDLAPLDKTLRNPFVREYAGLIYETSSSTDAAPRFRVIFILDHPITASEHKDYIDRLMLYFDRAPDPLCKDACRIWYGSTRPNYAVREGVILPVAILEQLPKPARPPATDLGTDVPAFTGKQPTKADLINAYRTMQAGRNYSLLIVAGIARDHGIDRDTFSEWLVPVYAAELPRQGFSNPKQEPNRVRVEQALRTIKSAYSYDRHPIAADHDACLPNEAFEALARLKLPNVARVYDALLRAGFVPGQVFQAKDAISALTGIAQKTVRSALNACIEIDLTTGEKLSEKRFIFPVWHPVSTLVETRSQVLRTTVPNGEINSHKRGRPLDSGKLYTFLSIPELCCLLGVDPAGFGDSVSISALESTATFKLEKHAKLIERNPGKQYSVKLLAARLNVGRSTIYRYNRRAHIQTRAVYCKIRITWGNIDKLPFADPNEESFTMSFVEDATDIDVLTQIGEKHPPYRGIALKLLKAGRVVYWTQRQASAYTYRPSDPDCTPIIKIRFVN